MKAQEIYDKVLFALRAQGAASTQTDPQTGETECAYRGDNGCKCAAGHLIPDAMYDSSMERQSIAAILVNNPELKSTIEIDAEQIVLLRQLQVAHDRGLTKSTEAWERWMRGIAEEHGLTYTEPTPVSA